MAAKMRVGFEGIAARVRNFELRSTGNNSANNNNKNGLTSPTSPQSSGSMSKFFGSASGDESSTSVSPAKSDVASSMFAAPKKVAIVLPTRRMMQPRTKEEWFEHLLSSEEEYCELLKTFRDHYVRPLKDDSKLAKPVYFSRTEFQKLVVFLTNVEALLTLNSKFRDELKARRTSGLGEVLEQYATLFQMYGQYAADYTGAVDAIDEQNETNEKFTQFLLQKEEATGKSIYMLMRLPMERIQVYTESVERLLEMWKKDDLSDAEAKELASLRAASAELQRTAEHVQEQQLATIRLERFKEIQHEWTGGNLLAGSVARQFIMEGDLEKFSRKQPVRYRFLLFSDMLAYGVPTTLDKVRFKRSLPLVTMVVEETVNSAGVGSRTANKRDSRTSLDGNKEGGFEESSSTGNGDEFSFFILTPTKSFKVAADSAESRASWLAELRFYIDQAKAKGETGETTAKEVHLKPVWVQDAESKACMKCNIPFTMIRRRHHCRRCGMLVCAPCSRTRMAVHAASGKDSAKTKEMRVRVCDDCAKHRPSVRFSAGFDAVALQKQLSAEAERENDDEDDNSSDEEKMASFATNGSMGRRSSSTGDAGDIVFDDNAVALSQALCCIVVEPRSKEQLQNPDEIALELNDEVNVEEIVEGWATGTNLRTGEYGYLPANFVVMKDTKEELPFFYDGSAVQQQQLQQSKASSTAARRLSSDSLSGDQRRLSLNGDERRASLNGNNGLGVVVHRRTSSNNTSDENNSDSFLKTHRRSSSNPEEVGTGPRRTSAATTQHAPLLTFTDKRSLIMNEIVVTERTYLSSLNTLLSVFVRPLVADYKSGKPQYGGSVLAVMNEAGDGAAMSVFMSRLEHIVTLNSKLAIDLEARLSQWATAASPERGGDSTTCTCGDVFLRYAPLFNMYDEYSSSYEFATKTLVDREKTDAKLAKFFEDQSANNTALLKQQTLLSLLITPIQRVPRYLLLLKEMQKQTPESHPDLQLIEKAIQTISQVASHINEHIRERENMVALRELDREFGGAEQLTDNPTRVFIHRGDLVKQSRKKNDMYQFWLFSDMLMYQKKTFGPKGVYAKPPKRIEMKSLSVVDVPEDASLPEGQRFAFDLVSQAKSFRVFAADQMEKDKWVRSLQEAIESATGGKGLAKGETAPVWKQDTAACEVCGAGFTLLFRRHHCRACGKCVCERCSKNRLFLKHVDESKEVRVCQPCFDSLADTAPRKPPPKFSKSASTSSSSSPGGSALSKAFASGGTKRSQSESSLRPPSVEMSPASSNAIAGIVDHRQITMISQQMSQRRNERQGSYSSLGSSEAGSPGKASPLPLARDASSGSSSVSSTKSPVRPTAAPIGSSKLRNVTDATPSLFDEEEAALEEPQAKKKPSPPAPMLTSASVATTPIKSKETPSPVKKRGFDDVEPPFGRPDAFTDVLQQIKREVPLEAPKAVPKPMVLMETPKPISPVRIASPATLSPVSPSSSPKMVGRTNPLDSSPIAASLAGANDELPEREVASVVPTAGEEAKKPPPPATRPASANSAKPTLPATRPTSITVSKPAPPATRPASINSTKQPAAPVAKTNPTDAASEEAAPKTNPLPPARPKATATSRPATAAPVLPAARPVVTSGSTAAKPPPPPLPKRRPSNLGSMARTESSKSMSRTESTQSLQRVDSKQDVTIPPARRESLRRSETADTAGSCDPVDFDML